MCVCGYECTHGLPLRVHGELEDLGFALFMVIFVCFFLEKNVAEIDGPTVQRSSVLVHDLLSGSTCVSEILVVRTATGSDKVTIR